jgi:hypothetical protein
MVSDFISFYYLISESKNKYKKKKILINILAFI